MLARKDNMSTTELTIKKIQNGYTVHNWSDEGQTTIYCPDLSAVNSAVEALFDPAIAVPDETGAM
jgi:hypothetical protein